jgi:hypothetical protein
MREDVHVDVPAAMLMVSPFCALLTQSVTLARSTVVVHVGLAPEQAACAGADQPKTIRQANVTARVTTAGSLDRAATGS